MMLDVTMAVGIPFMKAMETMIVSRLWPSWPWRGMLSCLVLALLGTMHETAHAQQTAEQQLAMLNRQFETAYERLDAAVVNLNGGYSQALERLFKAESTAGNLDGAVQVKAELAAFGDGSEYEASVFAERASTNRELEKLRATYLSQRSRLDQQKTKDAQPLVEVYLKQLSQMKDQFTKLGEIELAMSARKKLESVAADPRFSSDPKVQAAGKAFTGRIHVVGKGDYELRLNGDRIGYRNATNQKQKYVNATSRPKLIKAGDILVIRMSSPFVYRSFIVTIESDDGKWAFPIAKGDYRLIDNEGDLKNMDAAAILALEEKVQEGSPDGDMVQMWKERDLSDESLAGSEWVKIGGGVDWFTCAVVLRADMLKTLD